MANLFAVPLTLSEANELVSRWHRHHYPTLGHRFSIGVIDDQGDLHGSCIVGHPVARKAGHPRDVAEVLRLVTDGTPNACSFLYGAAARAAKAMGFVRIQTYVLGSETGNSLKASGWVYEGQAGGGTWKPNRPGRTYTGQANQPTEIKGRWAKQLVDRPDAVMPVFLEENDHPALFGI